MATKITDIFCDFLGDYCSRTIWNEPQKEYRHNIKLSLQKTRPQINIWSTPNESVVLPNGAQYFVYQAPLSHFAGLDVRSSGWQTVTALLLNTRIQLRVHDSTGKRLYSDKVFIKSSTVDRNLIFIAIDAAMMRKIVDTNENDLYIGVYYDSDDVNDIRIRCFEVTIPTINNIVNAASSATLVFKNGYVVRNLTASDLKHGDFVELIIDENITGTFVLDLSRDGDARMYVSSDGQPKYIIHIPKNVNPENKIISHDTCDFVIFPRNLNNADKLGRFFHRAQGTEYNSFIQLTHNDFGVPISLVDSFRGFLGTDEVVLYGYIRTHSRKVNVNGSFIDRKLVRDKNYIDFLYQLTDDQILDFLEGSGNADIEFWKASYLETSNYIKILKDTSTQQFNHSLDFYTDALGYINAASLLSKRVYRYIGLSGSGIIKRSITLPLVYQWKVCPVCGNAIGITQSTCPDCGSIQKTDQLMAVVYINGQKLEFGKVSSVVKMTTGLIENTAQLEVTINLGSGSIGPSDEVIFEICERKDFVTYIFEPTEQKRDFYVTYDDFDCYEEVMLNTGNVIESAAGLVDKKYIKVGEPDVVMEKYGDTVHISFAADQINKRFIVQTKRGSLCSYKNINTTVVNNENIVVIPSDNGHTTDEIDIVPTSDNRIVESQHLTTGCDVYKFEGSKYVKVTDLCSIDHVSVNGNKLRVTFPESLYNCICKVVFYMHEQSIPVLVDQQLVIYFNGKLLIENLDYMRIRPGLNIPYQYVLNNVSYLKSNDNYIELFGTDAEAVAYTSNFVKSSCIQGTHKSEFINSKNVLLMFYSYFTVVYTDGENLCKLKWNSGRLSNISDVVPTRNGAPFLAKTDLPPTIRKYLKEEYLLEDISKIKKIMDYFGRLTPNDPEIYTIPYSHRICSIYLNAIIDDVLDGRLVIPTETDIIRLLEYLTEYEYLKKYDLALKFIEQQELDINGIPTGRTIKTSVINRTFVDVFPSYTQRQINGTTLYEMLNRLIEYTIPTDTVVDTVGVDTTINDNQGHE